MYGVCIRQCQRYMFVIIVNLGQTMTANSVTTATITPVVSYVVSFSSDSLSFH